MKTTRAQAIMRNDILKKALPPVSSITPRIIAVDRVKASDRQVGGTHYKDDVIQHYEFCQRNRLTWCESAALKYMMRHRKKNGKQDILKAIHYLELLLEVEYPETQTKEKQ